MSDEAAKIAAGLALFVESETKVYSTMMREKIAANIACAIRAAIAIEREACAQAVEQHGKMYHWLAAHTDCAEVIRARTNNE